MHFDWIVLWEKRNESYFRPLSCNVSRMVCQVIKLLASPDVGESKFV